MDDTRLVFGIDLGTTYSCVAQVDKHDQAVVFSNFEGSQTTPSVVYFGEDNNVIVGSEAKELSKMEPERTVSFVKRHISTDEAYDKPTKFPNGLDPTDISAYILKKIVNDANNLGQFPEKIKKVVITCPAYFGTKERVRTKQAGEIAGLEVLGIINEPTAAAIAYGMKVQDEKVIMVYDLGGGTFDVTIIRVNGGAITVVASGGDHHLGGVDWDTALAEYLLNQYNGEYGISLKLDDDPALKNTLLILAEEKKRALSASPKVTANVSWDGKTSRVEITRDLFYQLTEFRLEETINKAKQVVEIAKDKGFTKIDEVILVGGSSRMPQIKERMDQEFNCDAKLTDPDQCVAKGAAIYAMNRAYDEAMEEYAEGERVDKPARIDKTNATRVVDTTNKTYGTDFVDDGKEAVQNLIFAHTPIDERCVGKHTFSTLVENQSGVSLKVFESDVVNESVIDPRMATVLDDGESHCLPLNKRWPKGTPVHVVFRIDTDGILHVHGEVEGDNHIDFQMKLKGAKDAKGIAVARNMVDNSTLN